MSSSLTGPSLTPPSLRTPAPIAAGLILTILLCGACSQTHTVIQDDPDSYAELNRRAENREATIRMSDASRRRARSLRVTREAAAWIDPETGDSVRVVIGDLHRVRIVQHARGAAAGFGMGAAVGAAIGYLAGDPGHCTDSSSTLSDLCFDFSGPLALIGGAAGGLAGLVTGGLVGVRHTYTFQADSGPRPAGQDASR